MNETVLAPPEFEELGRIARSGTFEDAMAALEQVVARLEAGQLSLADAVSWYELGLALSQRCAGLLQHVEQQVRVLESAYDLDLIAGLGDEEPAE